MSPYDAVVAFSSQVGRHTGLSVVVSPSPLRDPAPHAKVAVRKILRSRKTTSSAKEYEIRLFVSVDGRVESETGLKLAVDACQVLVDYLLEVTRLEDELGAVIPNTRITVTVNEDDGILEDPENGNVAWVEDIHFVTIWIPA